MADFITTLTETSSEIPVISTLISFVTDAIAAVEGLFPDGGDGGEGIDPEE